MICSKCGEYLDDNAIFCPNCGRKVGRAAMHDGNIMTQFNDSYNEGYSFNQTSANYNAGTYTKPKNKVIAIAIAFFFGSIGGHDFYLGNMKNGAIKLALTIFGLGFISEMWAIVDLFNLFTGRVTTDFNGNPLV